MQNFLKKSSNRPNHSHFWDIFVLSPHHPITGKIRILLFYTFFGLLALLCRPHQLRSQNISEIATALAREGFRNIQISDSTGPLVIAFENDRYRFLPDALYKASQVLNPLIPENRPYKIVVLKTAIPIFSLENNRLSISFSTDSSQKGPVSSTQFVSASEWKKIKKQTRINSTFGNIELVIEPEFNWQIGNYKYPFRYLLNLMPTVQTSLWKGMNLQAQFIIPTLDGHFTNNYKYFRPGIISLHQLFRLPWQSFMNVSAGLYSDFRYGTSLTAGIFLFGGHLMLEGNFHYTGYGTYLNHGGTDIYQNVYYRPTFVLAPLSYTNYQAAANIFIPQFDIFSRISHGRWLYFQTVTELQVYRKFGEVSLGFVFYDFGDYNNFGFTLNLPLYPYKYPFNKKFRVRTFDSMNFSYLAKNNFAYDFRTGWAMKSFFEDFNPRYVRNTWQSFFRDYQ